MDLTRPPFVRLFPFAALMVVVASVILAFVEDERQVELAFAEPAQAEAPADTLATNSDEATAAAPKITPVTRETTRPHDLGSIRTFAEQFCLECHTAENAEGDLSLDVLITDDTNSESSPALIKTWGKVVTALRSGHMPPGDAKQPPESQRRSAIDSIEQQRLSLICNADPDPGRVTIRRLTRVEYQNTIRDLVGVEFNATEDFPADDVGYGFDNIGDVLSMPPILLERYLSAAERVLDKAIVSNPTVKTEHVHFAPETFRQAPEPEDDEDLDWLTMHGELFIEYNAPHDGRYRLVFRAAGQQAGPDPVRMAAIIDNVSVREFVVKNKRHFPADFELETQLTRGRHRIAIEFLNDYWNPDAEKRWQRDRNLQVQSIEIHGPFDAEKITLSETHKRIFFVTPEDAKGAEAAAAKIIKQFANRAFRRPAKAEEVARLLKLFRTAKERGDTFEASVQVALSAVLVSPHFLFRVELDREPTEPGGAYRIGDYELASRLSYFLWSSTPDEELLDLAAAGRLSQPDVLDGQVTRMLKSPKSRSLVDNFAAQWLQLRRLAQVRPDTTQFPFDDELRKAMYDEVAGLFETVIREDRDVFELLNADYTFLNERLAKHYGIEGVIGDKMRKVALTDRRRGGVLTAAAVLTVTSNPTRTSPVKRGKWILEQLLGVKNESPPDIPQFEEEAPGAEEGLSLRERLKRHTSNPSCAACHLRLDPMGFALENYDAVGRWREQDGELPVDAAATMPNGTEFTGAIGLRKVLVDHRDEYEKCLTRAMLTFALGRGLEYYDACAVQRIAEQVAAEDHRFSAVVRGIVHSYPFQFRRTLRKDEVENE